ncbi:hypothetical protein D3C71_2081340 [compost metagenome]
MIGLPQRPARLPVRHILRRDIGHAVHHHHILRIERLGRGRVIERAGLDRAAVDDEGLVVVDVEM